VVAPGRPFVYLFIPSRRLRQGSCYYFNYADFSDEGVR
jgi:hypothetical protein